MHIQAVLPQQKPQLLLQIPNFIIVFNITHYLIIIYCCLHLYLHFSTFNGPAARMWCLFQYCIPSNCNIAAFDNYTKCCLFPLWFSSSLSYAACILCILSSLYLSQLAAFVATYIAHPERFLLLKEMATACSRRNANRQRQRSAGKPWAVAFMYL